MLRQTRRTSRGPFQTALLALGLLFAPAGHAVAQTTGWVDGQVLDVQGQPFPEVSVRLSGEQGVRSSQTDGQGRYNFPLTPPGSYWVRIEKHGFATIDAAVAVNAGKHSVVTTLVLRIGTVEELQEISGTPPAPDGHSIFDSDAVEGIEDSRLQDVAGHPRSVFSLDVDTASYARVRRSLQHEGRLPPAEAVRIEELVNYFSYEYPEPGSDRPFSVTTEIGACPWAPDHRLLLIGLQARRAEERTRPARNLVFLVDVSASMNEPRKLPLVKHGLRQLASQLTARDRIAVVVYAGASGLALDATPGDRKTRIADAISLLEPGGPTAGAMGIELAYRLAEANLIEGGLNRVVLMTDGDFNLGVTVPGELIPTIERRRAKGVTLSVLGFGMGNLRDAELEKLAASGNGTFAYIENPAGARKALSAAADTAFVTIAKDAKVEVEFNPLWVKDYRLIGYEDRALAHNQPGDDGRDAADVAAGHTISALYELVPADPAGATAPAPGGAWLNVKLHYKEPGGMRSRQIDATVTDAAISRQASPNLRFAATVATFGMLLRGFEARGDASYEGVGRAARAALGADPQGYRKEFVELVERAAALTRTRLGRQ